MQSAILLLSALLLAGPPRQATRAASAEIEWAEFLATKDLRLDSPDLVWLWKLMEDEYGGCDGEGFSELPPEKLTIAKKFLELSCRPYLKWWERSLAACDKKKTPAWCDDDEAVFNYMGVRSYFETIVSGIQASQDHVVRFNLMGSLLGIAMSHAVTEFPRSTIESLYADAIRVFLVHAPPGDALIVAGRMKKSWIRLSPPISAVFSAYAENLPPERADDAHQLRQLLEEK